MTSPDQKCAPKTPRFFGSGAARELIPPPFVSLLLVIITLAVYWPVVNWDYVDYDDPEYVINNSHIQKGLSLESVAWAFRTDYASNWHPLTWLSHAFDVELFGKAPAGPHLTNLLIHAANAALLFVLLRRLTGSQWQSLLVAALFALHPLHVESVAWISERKDVLSTFFGLLVLLFYARYAQKQSKVESRELRAQTVPGLDSRSSTLDYFLSLLFFACGLMSKPMLVTLPFVMLLLDYWPLQRGLRFKVQGSGFEVADTSYAVHDFRLSPLDLRLYWRLVLEKIPFFVFSAGSSFVTLWVQVKAGAVLTLEHLPLSERIANAVVSYPRYLGKIFWPAVLALPYPHPGQWPLRCVILSVLLLVGICIGAFWLGRWMRFLFTGWFWFFGMLIPVIGLVQVGTQSIADRYTYLPSIGIFIIVVWGVGKVWEHWRWSRTAIDATAVLMLVLCVMLTRSQLGYWRNGETLFRHAVEVTKDNVIAYGNLGYCLAVKGQIDEAVENFRKALQLDLENKDIVRNLERALTEMERDVPPTGAPTRAANYAAIHAELARALVEQKRFAEAATHYERALRLIPDDAQTHYNLGLMWSAQGRTDRAMAEYLEALRCKPDFAEAHNNLGVALTLSGKAVEALPHFNEALRLNANYAEAHNNIAYALIQLGRRQEAIEHLREALRLKPDYEQARKQLQQLGVSMP